MIAAELLDVVDEHDNVVGTYTREEVYKNGLRFTRFVEVFIRNNSGRLWIPIRSKDKVISPGGFDIGVGGHIEHGESEIDAFRKEIREEIGWDIDEVSWRYIGKYGPADGLDTISYVYEITTVDTPVPNKDDFLSYQWLLPAEIADKIKSGHPAKSNILPLLSAVYRV